MIALDTIDLARAQFTLNIAFHILFPTLTIGLAWVLLYFRLRYTFSNSKSWEYAYYFWVKVFALTFALGVVSGVTMSFQFGTNWPRFIEYAGNIAGPLLGYEVLTAFFLEATFLGIMLFGKDRVSNRVHLFSAATVAVGTTLSAFWILSLNSWMHTPQGYEEVDGVLYAVSWMQIVFNPSFPYRLAYMLVASLLTSAFVLAGISAYRTARGLAGPATAYVLRTGVIMAAVLAPLQLVVGDLHGLNTLEHEPAKIAAVEGIWRTQTGAPLTLFGIPDEQRRETRYAIEIPKAASLILTHELDGELRGLEAFDGEHPPVGILFWAFRTMVGVGLLMIFVAWWSAWFVFRGRELPAGPLRVLAAMTFSGWVATIAGWTVTEVGRQPWLIVGVMRTADAAAPHPVATLAGSLLAYAVLYAVLLAAYVGTLRHMSIKPASSRRLLENSGTSAVQDPS
jgi:cytochrome d ubiquinol oxidase subunit I